MLEAVERAGVFGGYLEDLCYTPKTLKAIRSVEDGALGDVTWVRSRETHPGPHSAWFWDGRLTGGGAIIDLGCHCIEIIRNFVGKGNRPVAVMCTTDTLVHPIDDEDNAIALIRFESGAIGQFEVSWTFRGGMDLRDEVAGTHGTIWLNHFLRTGLRDVHGGRLGGYVAEKAETAAGWLFPVGDEVSELGYVDMFTDMFDAIDGGRRRRRRRSTTATSSTRSWTPLPVGEERGLGAGGAVRVAGRDDAADHGAAGETLRGPHGDQARAAPRRPGQDDPQGRGDRATTSTGSSPADEPGGGPRGRRSRSCPRRRGPGAVAARLAARLRERPDLWLCLPTGRHADARLRGAGRRWSGGARSRWPRRPWSSSTSSSGLPPGDPARCDARLRRELLDRLVGAAGVPGDRRRRAGSRGGGGRPRRRGAGDRPRAAGPGDERPRRVQRARHAPGRRHAAGPARDVVPPGGDVPLRGRERPDGRDHGRAVAAARGRRVLAPGHGRAQGGDPAPGARGARGRGLPGVLPAAPPAAHGLRGRAGRVGSRPSPGRRPGAGTAA